VKLKRSSTGIYTRIEGTPENADDQLAVLDEWFTSNRIETVLDSEEDRARQVLRERGIEWPKRPGQDPEARDAWEILYNTRQVRRAIAHGTRAGLLAAYRLGRFSERLLVREHEPDAARGKKALKAPSDGGKARWAEYRKLRPEARKLFRETRSLNPRITRSKICASIAASLGVSDSAVRKWTLRLK
jgi:hypothetical protein